jgi:multiple sugar transport system permease protein
VTFRRLTVYSAATLIAAWVAFPLVLITLAAFTPRQVLYAWPRPIWPAAFTLATMRTFLLSADVLQSTWNSLLVALMAIGFALLISAPAAYALARFRFRGRDAVQLLVLATKMFPAPILAIPLAVAFLRLGLYDTLFGVALVHTALAVPFVMTMVTGVFVAISYELEEAAMTLGSSRVQAVNRITLPMALPGLAAAGIFTFVLSWNEVFAATILTVDHRTLPALIMNAVFSALGGAPLDYRFAGGFFMIVPALVIIFLIRRYLLTLWGVTIR